MTAVTAATTRPVGALPETEEPPPSPAPPEGLVLDFPLATRDVAGARRAAFADALAAAAAAAERGSHREVVGLVEERRSDFTASPDLALEALVLEARARLALADVDGALELAEQARALAEQHAFTDADRAEALFELGAIRFRQGRIATASGLFTVALDLCERLPAGQAGSLRARLLELRSRCHAHNRDWEAAAADVETALELIEPRDARLGGAVNLQASIVAERSGQLLLAQFYADEARAGFERARDDAGLARALTHAGEIALRRDETEAALELLSRARAVTLEIGAEEEAVAALSALAEAHARAGDHVAAEAQARDALALLDRREDLVESAATVRLALGRILREQGRVSEASAVLCAAEQTFAAAGSTNGRAAALMAQAEVAAEAEDTQTAARLYRLAAETLQDVRF